jgi:hypothetical protein
MKHMQKRSDERIARLPLLTEAELGRPHYRFRNPLQPNTLDVRVEPIFDFFSVAVNTAVRKETLFSIAQGQQYTGAGAAGAIIKTAYHTSMITGGQLDAPKKMLVKDISVAPRNDIHYLDAVALTGIYLLQFSVSGKDYFTVHPFKTPQGGGPFVSGAGTFTAPASALACSNGWPSANNISPLVDMDMPGMGTSDGQAVQAPPINGVLIEQQQPFSVVMDPTLTAAATYVTQLAASVNPLGTVGTGINCWVYLEGDYLVAVL